MNARTAQLAIDEALQKTQRAENALRDMRRDVRRYSEIASAAGFGLDAIGNLLGADASEHHIDEEMSYGLANAVVALGALLRDIGDQTWLMTEEDEQ